MGESMSEITLERIKRIAKDIKEELKGKGLTSYGQSIDESTHLRVYIEEK